MALPAQAAVQNDRDAVWIALSKAEAMRSLSIAVSRELGCPVLLGPKPPNTGHSPIGVVLADQTHFACINTARRLRVSSQQSILTTPDRKLRTGAEYIVDARCKQDELLALIQAAYEYREFITSFGGETHRRVAALGGLRSAEYEVRGHSEARDLAIMLSLACPNPNRVAAGLQILLINAIELGNLEIDRDERRELVMSGRLRGEINQRMADPHFAERRVSLRMTRTERLISFLIQDDGAGANEALLEREAEAGFSDRTPGVNVVERLGFSTITRHGGSSVVETTIRL